MGNVEREEQVGKKMSALANIREAILDILAGHLSLTEKSLERLRINGRLDEFTAVDSLLMVELVLLLEEHFEIRFDPENIDTELISDLDKLAAFVARVLPVS